MSVNHARVPPDTPRLLIGTHTFAAAGESARRQAAGVASLRALRDVEIVNVQFERNPHHADGLPTLPALRGTSNGITGRRGPTKPIMSEMFDALATHAASRNLASFCFTNADIIFSQDAVDWMLSGPRDAFVLSRQDFDGRTGTPTTMEVAGTDVFAIATRWWAANRTRFRPYIAGEGGWDNVYTAVLLCHGDTVLENRRPLVRHEIHPPGPMPSSHFGEYVRMLCALDAGYFSLWCRYWDGLLRLRNAKAGAEEEAAWAREVFVWKPTTGERLFQAGRSAKARLRYRWWKLSAGEGSSSS
jgi:hypothetical protein